jgi:hypothetical protein
MVQIPPRSFSKRCKSNISYVAKSEASNLRVSGVPPKADQVSGKRNIEAET